MSRFSESMSFGNEALMDNNGDGIEYWPAGDEDEAIEIDAIWTELTTQELGDDRRQTQTGRAECQIFADDDRGVASVTLKADVIVKDGGRWVVMEILETVAGMHRLLVEAETRGVVGRARGRR